MDHKVIRGRTPPRSPSEGCVCRLGLTAAGMLQLTTQLRLPEEEKHHFLQNYFHLWSHGHLPHTPRILSPPQGGDTLPVSLSANSQSPEAEPAVNPWWCVSSCMRISSGQDFAEGSQAIQRGFWAGTAHTGERSWFILWSCLVSILKFFYFLIFIRRSRTNWQIGRGKCTEKQNRHTRRL